MRVLLINYEYPPVGGGASNATWEIARAMVKLGHEPFVLTARYKDRTQDLKNPGIKIIQVAAIRKHKDHCSIFEMATFVVSATIQIRRLLSQKKIDAMIAFFSIPGGPIAWWGWRGTQIPYIVSLRGGDVPGNEISLRYVHSLTKGLRGVILRSARLVVANSEGLRIASEKIDPYKVKVIPNGIDTEFWRPPRTVSNSKVFRFVFVGRFHSQKNLLWLFKRIHELSHSTKRKFELCLVGDGPQRQELLELANNLGIKDLLRWHGWCQRNELLKIYQGADCIINPSLYEGMSNVVLEGMACGLPPIVSAVAGTAELITSGDTGWIIPLDESGKALNTLKSCLDDREEVRRRGANARNRVLAQASWGGNASRLMACFNDGDETKPLRMPHNPGA